jgi:exoribonuclease R
MCTLTTMTVKHRKSSRKRGGRRRGKHDDYEEEELVLAQPVNSKLPWMALETVPDEYYQDLKEDRPINQRYYIAKFLEWTDCQRRPVVKITESIGEAGNLHAESMRLLRTHDICTEAYEDENEEPTENVHESLKMFVKNINPKTKEWIIPRLELQKREDLRDKRIFTIDPITAKDLDDALSID